MKELLHTVGACPTEAIDGLVIVSHDKQIILRRRKQLYDLILDRRDILKFIHQNITKLFLPSDQTSCIFLQQPQTGRHQIIKIKL